MLETEKQRLERLNSPAFIKAINCTDGKIIYTLHGEELRNFHAVEYYDAETYYWEEGEFIYPNEDNEFPTVYNGDEDVPAESLELRFDREIIEIDYL